MDTQKLYILLPHHDIPADGPLVLGSIISDLRDPDSINKGAVVKIPPKDIYTTHKFNWRHTTESVRGGNAGLMARYINPFLGGSLGGNCDSKTITQYNIPDLETTYFIPDQDYVTKAINKQKVRTFLEGSRYEPVYMITGLKIGRGPNSQVTISKSYGREGHINTGLPGSLAGFVVDTGNVTMRQAAAESVLFGGGSEIVLAYRLSKITFHEKVDGSQTTNFEKYTVGATFGDNDGMNGEDSSADLTVEIHIGGDEAVAEELGEEDLVTAIDEEDDQECRCFIVPPN